MTKLRIPYLAKSSAVVKPVGPAPTIRTVVSVFSTGATISRSCVLVNYSDGKQSEAALNACLVVGSHSTHKAYLDTDSMDAPRVSYHPPGNVVGYI